MAVLLDFLLQVTAFVALIVYDFRRAQDSRIDCFPCIRLGFSEENVEGTCLLMLDRLLAFCPKLLSRVIYQVAT